MISSLVGSPSGFSMTMSQCSKSHPSSKIVSLGGRFDQLGFGSLSDDEVARVDKAREEGDGRTRQNSAEATARGRRRWRNERGERKRRAGEEEAVEREREKSEDTARVLGRVRESIWVAIFMGKRWTRAIQLGLLLMINPRKWRIFVLGFAGEGFYNF